MPVARWLIHFFGVDYGAAYGHWVPYNFWSGVAGSFLVDLVVFFFAFYVHRTCQHSVWCLRWAKFPLAGGLAKECHRHHPDLQHLGGKKPRGAELHRLHREWQQSQ